MAGGDPHNKDGSKCSDCPTVFTKASMVLTIPRREGGFIVHRKVCRECHNRHHSKGE